MLKCALSHILWKLYFRWCILFLLFKHKDEYAELIVRKTYLVNQNPNLAIFSCVHFAGKMQINSRPYMCMFCTLN